MSYFTVFIKLYENDIRKLKFLIGSKTTDVKSEIRETYGIINGTLSNDPNKTCVVMGDCEVNKEYYFREFEFSAPYQSASPNLMQSNKRNSSYKNNIDQYSSRNTNAPKYKSQEHVRDTNISNHSDQYSSRITNAPKYQMHAQDSSIPNNITIQRKLASVEQLRIPNTIVPIQRISINDKVKEINEDDYSENEESCCIPHNVALSNLSCTPYRENSKNFLSNLNVRSRQINQDDNASILSNRTGLSKFSLNEFGEKRSMNEHIMEQQRLIEGYQRPAGDILPISNRNGNCFSHDDNASILSNRTGLSKFSLNEFGERRISSMNEQVMEQERLYHSNQKLGVIVSPNKHQLEETGEAHDISEPNDKNIESERLGIVLESRSLSQMNQTKNDFYYLETNRILGKQLKTVNKRLVNMPITVDQPLVSSEEYVWNERGNSYQHNLPTTEEYSLNHCSATDTHHTNSAEYNATGYDTSYENDNDDEETITSISSIEG